jgi:glucosamine--fructose-6-phosphate aminotransferase (isomerizing)
LGITASLESSLARQSDYLLLTKVGDEGLVMIKSYITEVAASLLLSLQLARCGGFISDGQFEQLHKELVASPDEVRRITEEKEELMRSLAEEYQKSRSIFLLGNGPNFPTALEGMLKLKECTYAHAEAVSSNEFRHGYINALIKDTPAILIAPLSSRSHRQLVAIGRDVKNVDGRLVVLGTKGDDVLKELADHFVEMPSGYGELISPILYIVPLQLLAYYGALARGINPDEPERSVIFMSKKTLDGVERVFLAQS